MRHPDTCVCYPCRGRRAHATRLLRESQAAVAAEARVYSNPEKQRIRAVLLRAVERFGGPVLDLWGGGESARQVRAAFPDVRIVAADNQRAFARALVHDATRYGYEAHVGRVEGVTGQYSVINLDTTNGVAVSARLAAAMLDHLTPEGVMLVTVMGTDRHDAYAVRSAGFAAELSAATGLRVVGVFRYRMLSRVPAFVIALTRIGFLNNRDERTVLLRPVNINEAVERDGFYTARDFVDLMRKDYVKNKRVAWRVANGVPVSDRTCACVGCEGVILADSYAKRRYCSSTCAQTPIHARHGRKDRRVAA